MVKKRKKIKITRRDFIKAGIAIGLFASIFGYLGKEILNFEFENKKEDKSPKLKEVYFYTKIGNAVKCLTCPNECLIKEGELSWCRTKINIKGKLYTLAYSNPCAVHIDPIEKKPLYHFLPGSKAFSIATAGCNFRCLYCQNWTISQTSPLKTRNYDLPPEEVVENALKYDCQSIAYTYSEPNAWFEYMYDTAKIAKQYGIKNLWITNGYLNEKPLRMLCKVIDAANVDLKNFKEEIYEKLNGGKLKHVLRTLKILKEEKVWFEITNLVVPQWTDDLEMIREMCKWIYKNLGPDYPLHFSRFFPHYKLQYLPPTPIETLEKAREIAIDEGLKFVYIGNVPLHPANNTYCPKCGNLLIERKGYNIKIVGLELENGSCKKCGEKIAGVWSE